MATLFSNRLDTGVFTGRNAIINGDFRWWQRGSSFNPLAGAGYSADRWRAGETTDGSMRADRESTIKPYGTNYSFKATVVTGDSSLAAGQYAYIFQRIEGYNYLQFVGKTATLSFWARSSLTGTYSVAFRGGDPYENSYAVDYTINSANTWEYKTITIKFDHGGTTWNTVNGVGVDILFSLGCGSTYSTAPNQWASGNKIASTNQVNWMATAGNTFYLANVQLELGSEATPFEFVENGIQVLQILRYYEVKYYYSQVTQTATGSTAGYGYNQVPYIYKRANPTVTYSGATIWQPGAWRNATNVYLAQSLKSRMFIRVDDTAGNAYTYGAALIRATFYIDAEL